MPPGSDVDPHDSPRALFAFELRQHRATARLSQRELARRMGYSDAMVAMVETAKRPPSERFAELCDEVLGLDGTMTRLYIATTWNKAPEYFRPWLEEEQEATGLRSWEPMLIPGLFQTEAYARLVLSAEPGTTSDEVDERVRGRMQRKAILHRHNPPLVSALVDEAVIRRPVGDTGVMWEQLSYLLEVARHPQVTIQVVPYSARAMCGLLGGFIIAERNEVPYTAYVEGQPNGRTVEDRNIIGKLMRRYDAIRAEAVPFSQSLRLIEEAVNQSDS
ncbi:helix-turn-helix transcriptional regulator [Sphaerisporangium sp. NPDC088356]|uniref:helix-turn-helix domain-containing protein n=1 Tax=Sphaerisporangium sp. NPDC088356 TaxID=3154871 RepID=UPI0034360CED